MKALKLVFLSMALASLAQAETKHTSCELRGEVANHDIKGIETLDQLMEGSTFVNIASDEAECGSYEGQLTTCENNIEKSGLSVRYTFNSQNGQLELSDAGGQESYAIWTNEYELTKSGYLALDTALTNRRGGLGGNPRMFQVTATCGWAR